MDKLRDWWMRTTEEGRRDARENPDRGGSLTIEAGLIAGGISAVLLLVWWLLS